MIITTTIELSCPDNTVVIANDEFITLARKDVDTGTIYLFTCPAEDVGSYDLNEDNMWMEFTVDELKAAAAL